MEARNYNPLAKRSRYRNLKWSIKDSVSLTISLLTLGVSIASLILMNNVFDYVLTDTFFKDIIVNIINYIKGWF